MYESNIFWGMHLGLKDKEFDNFFIPMVLILLFVVIEIFPFLFVLDWDFMEIFIIKGFPISVQEPLFENQNLGNTSYISMHSNHNAGQIDFRSGMSSS